MNTQKILISRTDAIGDVILTLPLCGVIKEHFPHSTIIFLGKTYTKDVIACCKNVDLFLDWNTIQNNAIEEFRKHNIDTVIHVFPNKEIAKAAKKAGIKTRIGTGHRLYNWWYCNQRVSLSRKSSDLHEAQLNIKLAQQFLKTTVIPKPEDLSLFYNVEKPLLDDRFQNLLSKDKFNLVLHPKSQGSAKEWKLKHYQELIDLLPQDEFQVFISGTEKEALLIEKEIPGFLENPKIVNVTAKFSLKEFVAFIGQANGLLACSTGPLHIAAMLGIHALGIYPNNRPMFPRRWSPIGEKATFVQFPFEKGEDSAEEDFMNKISPEEVAKKIKSWK